jgi:hypothetical protein
MSTLLKDIYSASYYDRFSNLVEEVIPSFDKTKFIQSIFNHDWEQKELKERVKHTALVLHDFLPEDFDLAVEIIVRKQSFRIITTRTFYLDVHTLSIIINGQEQMSAEFELITK